MSTSRVFTTTQSASVMKMLCLILVFLKRVNPVLLPIKISYQILCSQMEKCCQLLDDNVDQGPVSHGFLLNPIVLLPSLRLFVQQYEFLSFTSPALVSFHLYMNDWKSCHFPVNEPRSSLVSKLLLWTFLLLLLLAWFITEASNSFAFPEVIRMKENLLL